MHVDSEHFDFTIRLLAWRKFCDPGFPWPSAVRDDLLETVQSSAALFGLEDAFSFDASLRLLHSRLRKNCLQVQIDLRERLEMSVERTHMQRSQSLPSFAAALARRADVPNGKLRGFIAKAAIWRRFVLECRGPAEQRLPPLGFTPIREGPEPTRMVDSHGTDVPIPQLERKSGTFWDAYEQFYKCLELSLGPACDAAYTGSWAAYLDKVIESDVSLFTVGDDIEHEAEQIRQIISGPRPGCTLLGRI